MRREEGGQQGTAAVWASSLLARLLKVIIEFLCRASPPYGILLCIHYKADREYDTGRTKEAKRKVGRFPCPFFQSPYMKENVKKNNNTVMVSCFLEGDFFRQTFGVSESSHTCKRPHSCSAAAEAAAHCRLKLQLSRRLVFS